MCINDEYEAAKGTLVLTLTPAGGGADAIRSETPLEIPPLGAMTYDFVFEVPATQGEHLLLAKAYRPSKKWSPALSRRKVSIVPSQKRAGS